MLHLHRSERADRLVDGLAEVLREPPDDPFAPEVVAVPAKGVERWLSQRLSHVLGASPDSGDGVCANVRFPHPSRLVAHALAAAAGIDPDDDPWDPDRLLWALLETIDECAPQEWCSTLAGHLGVNDTTDSHRRGRRLTTARHMARLYDSYGAHRPAMLQGWATGENGDLPDDLRWQAELWRRVRARIGLSSAAERLPPACERLRAEPDLVELPQRLSLYGPTRLTTAQLDVLAALAEHRAVHLWLPHPSPALWDRVAPLAPRVTRRHDDPTADMPDNPLLASLGRDARELQLKLAGCRAEVADHHHRLADRQPTMLGRLQTSLQGDEPTRSERSVLDPADRSLQVHACHGPERQVEVLREVLVGLLAADPMLEPRDVLVMCPDIEDYAPLISATFGLTDDSGDETDRHPGHRLRVKLADRSLRQTNPLLATAAALLELADARLTASQVLDLAASAPVRRRFRFTDDDLERLQQWVAASGIRWGIDGDHRAPFGLDTVPQNTWRTGLDRVLLGATMAEDGLRWVDKALPLDDVDSSDIDLAGRLAELVDRLSITLDDLTGEHPLTHWLETLTTGLARLTDIREADAWQSGQVERELAQVANDAGDRASSLPLSLADIRALLADRLRGQPTRANFRTGELTMCSMVPMRSVPHRVICLLGLDDGRFPRTTVVDGDDVLAREPRVGERDPRSEDRQLLLDAILAAGDHLVILYTGADPRTNARRPPAVPVGEILDAADALARTADGRPVREQLVVHHPLQPFDPRNFVPGRLGTDRPFSFDRQALAGAVRADRPRDNAGPFLHPPLAPPAEPAELALDDLIAFLEHPAKAFLRQRLGVTLAGDDEELDDALAVDLDPLQKWAVGDRLLRARLSGASAATCKQAEWRRQTLPPGELGRRVVDAVMAEVEPLVAASTELRTGATGRAFDVAVEVAWRRLVGTVGGVYGDTVVRVEFSRLAPKHRLRAWAQLLALTAAVPDATWMAVTIGRGGKSGVAISHLGPVDETTARQHLIALVELRARGLGAPLPMAVRTSATYAAKRGESLTAANAEALAGREWAADRYDGEQADPAHRLVWGDAAPLAVLLAEKPSDDEQPVGWLGDEPHRFGALARRLWEPLLAAEKLEQS